VLILSFAGLCIAQTNDADYIVIKPQPNMIFEDSSEFHRINKQHAILAQIAGIGPNSTFSHGLIYNYFYSRNQIFHIEATNNSMVDRTLSTAYELSATSFGLYYKRFLGNSLYIRGGIDQRRIDYTYNNGARQFQGSSTAAGVLIGNQWNWNHITFGCDWVGFSQPFASSISGERLAVPSVSELAVLQDDQNRLVKNGVVNLLRVYLGASF